MTAHTRYLSFFYNFTFWGLKILHQKVLKFAPKNTVSLAQNFPFRVLMDFFAPGGNIRYVIVVLMKLIKRPSPSPSPGWISCPGLAHHLDLLAPVKNPNHGLRPSCRLLKWCFCASRHQVSLIPTGRISKKVSKIAKDAKVYICCNPFNSHHSTRGSNCKVNSGRRGRSSLPREVVCRRWKHCSSPTVSSASRISAPVKLVATGTFRSSARKRSTTSSSCRTATSTLQSPSENCHQSQSLRSWLFSINKWKASGHPQVFEGRETKCLAEKQISL